MKLNTWIFSPFITTIYKKKCVWDFNITDLFIIFCRMKLAVKFPVNIFHCGQQQLASKMKIDSVDLKLILINFAYLTPLYQCYISKYSYIFSFIEWCLTCKIYSVFISYLFIYKKNFYHCKYMYVLLALSWNI